MSTQLSACIAGALIFKNWLVHQTLIALTKRGPSPSPMRFVITQKTVVTVARLLSIGIETPTPPLSNPCLQ
jgi:hypothetical protein